ncbi:MAG: hypothetical protein SGILL_009139 [Bacillariaceae sp.]
MDPSFSSYQNASEDSVPSDEQEQVSLLSGYGAVFDPEAPTESLLEDDGSPFVMEDAEMKRKSNRRWMLVGVAALLYVVATIAFVANRSASGEMAASAVANVELLGSSKAVKDAKKAEKLEAKKAKEAEKADAKAAKEAAKKAAKEKKAEEKAAKKAEKDKEKEAAAAKKAAEKKAKEPVPYPGSASVLDGFCSPAFLSHGKHKVEVTYIKTPLPFFDHEFAANASGCHLASVHNMVENSKMAKDGLFKVALGPEIGMSFASGKPLAKTFWLGGYHLESDIDGSEWTDDSPWDFGLDFTNATEGCLSTKVNFTELAFLNITVEDHWELMDCETPLPAVYKCCTMPANATVAPKAVPSF